MLKRQSEIKINTAFDNINKVNEVSNNEISYSDLTNQNLLLREFDRINNRIDMLMMNGSNTMSSYRVMNTTPVQQPMSAPVPPVVSTQPIVDSNANNNSLINKLNRDNQLLQEELRVLYSLSNNGADDKYADEIKQLRNKINIINDSLKNKTFQQNVYNITEKDPILKGLENYNHKIFFANNSKSLSTDDVKAIQKIGSLVKENSPRITVVLRGFASNKGSALYNNQLSFERAEAIKEELLKNGLSAKDIMTMHHGIDNSKDESKARRVEITFLVQ